MASPNSGVSKVLIYLLRRDLRVTDNPVLDEVARLYEGRDSGEHISSQPVPDFTHLLPLYVFPAQQVDVSGFLHKDARTRETGSRKPYAPARSQVGNFPRTGPHRAKFTAESVWDLKQSFQKLGSDLVIRAGRLAEVLDDMIEQFERDDSVLSTEDGRLELVGVWMTSDALPEEKEDEAQIKAVLENGGKQFRLFGDEKYFVDDADLPYSSMNELPDVYTTFRKSLEPLRSKPRPVRAAPQKGSLPPFPTSTLIPPQFAPYEIPTTLETLTERLLRPLDLDSALNFFNAAPSEAHWVSTYTAKQVTNAHPLSGGETRGQHRVQHLLRTGAMTLYHETRNGLVGEDFSTKLSGYLAIGALTARWVHWQMHAFEEGKIPASSDKEADDDEDEWKAAPGFGGGESEGTAGVRFELLWRDYMRLCAQKFGARLFLLDGFRGASARPTTAGSESTTSTITSPTKSAPTKTWRFLTEQQEAESTSPKPTTLPASANNAPSFALSTQQVLHRFVTGTTGIGLIDASMRELAVTGYTSNRARQNCASFLSSPSHLGVDWRLGAEWYECCLVDYDGASNWGNWQYVAGVGNDPREGRVFNPVKQAVEYDGRGEYVRAWVAELREVRVGEGGVEGLMGVFQGWRLEGEEREGLEGVEWVERPLVRIPFEVARRPREGGRRARGGAVGRGGGENRARGRGGRGRGQSRGGGGEKGRGRGQGGSRGSRSGSRGVRGQAE
ncbi:cryptochrome [Eremomyces bilateralis CBS 781.70]|uniref:Cryptochrome DASH n=1 Tax=Eremomyces bilateralis CBS 781.70 TaxID=1392243 RepID=A0A6G1FSX4_9PEZI|nr:cryptochrome [Eremomyces bilateralis CBS 781.70]KAF1808836.1 cryptochrome [Eremomyces bilateralis CBS 781.70]